MAVSLKLDKNLKQRVDKLASTKDRSAHWIMCEAIRDYVRREQAREDMKDSAMAAWRHYKETGLHITGEEAVNWLSTWGTEDETEAPECHS